MVSIFRCLSAPSGPLESQPTCTNAISMVKIKRKNISLPRRHPSASAYPESSGSYRQCLWSPHIRLRQAAYTSLALGTGAISPASPWATGLWLVFWYISVLGWSNWVRSSQRMLSGFLNFTLRFEVSGLTTIA